jgi:hypothetical protein
VAHPNTCVSRTGECRLPPWIPESCAPPGCPWFRFLCTPSWTVGLRLESVSREQAVECIVCQCLELTGSWCVPLSRYWWQLQDQIGTTTPARHDHHYRHTADLHRFLYRCPVIVGATGTPTQGRGGGCGSNARRTRSSRLGRGGQVRHRPSLSCCAPCRIEGGPPTKRDRSSRHAAAAGEQHGCARRAACQHTPRPAHTSPLRIGQISSWECGG